ncbi:NAD(P)-dependent oxidoreductase [Roseibium alexandrii]|uniref:2-hydroxy-3-oxopropionate reductase n=1 Tax=Roseibium alexandrii TaxID=388408 RepID=A0A0M6ZSD3_9HYPH|nr:NAD(P)-dependent oxidoreductase [Roseibium alexandrii]CTQ65000.1 2-hydroxy-3-oxopropionate reductase [Roseibium alexandrii]
MKIGFAGLGRMGARMAANLVVAGHEMRVWNRTASKADVFARDHGAKRAASPRDLAEKCDVVISMLADDSAVADVYFDPDSGLLAGAGSPVVAEMGTVSVPAANRLFEAASSCGKRFVDAPVSGATKAAEDAQLLIMAGSDAAYAQELGPVFSVLGKRTIWLGGPGKGAAMKLGVNMLIHGLNQTLSEALALMTSAGIAPETAYEVIENSAAAAPVIHYRKGQYLDEAAHDVTFTVALARKDVSLALDLARSVGVTMPQADLNRSVLSAAGEAGYDARDMASIYAFVKRELS